MRHQENMQAYQRVTEASPKRGGAGGWNNPTGLATGTRNEDSGGHSTSEMANGPPSDTWYGSSVKALIRISRNIKKSKSKPHRPARNRRKVMGQRTLGSVGDHYKKIAYLTMESSLPRHALAFSIPLHFRIRSSSRPIKDVKNDSSQLCGRCQHRTFNAIHLQIHLPI